MTTVNLGRSRGGARTPKMIINKKKAAETSTDIMSFPSDLGTHQFIMQFVKYNLIPTRVHQKIQNFQWHFLFLVQAWLTATLLDLTRQN